MAYQTDENGRVILNEDTIPLLAACGEELPQWAPVEERAFYNRLRLLYVMFKDGAISAADGKQHKTQALLQFRQDVANRESVKKDSSRLPAFWKRIELATSAYCREPTIENADKIISALYGMDRKHIYREENI